MNTGTNGRNQRMFMIGVEQISAMPKSDHLITDSD